MSDSAHAPDLSVDDFERAQPVRFPPSVWRGAFALLVILLALIVALVLLDHRSTTCHLEITKLGKGADVQHCAP